ncbi:MAG: metallophosphoesterase [Dehalococcoidia bacterium]|nr:metallophosphoesterase [Dehalococcoidia bacterium]
MTSNGSGRFSRRSFLRMAALSAFGVGSGLGSAALFSAVVAPYKPVVEKVEVNIAGLPPGAPPLRIVQLSDIHIGPRFTVADIRRGVDLANTLKPDLVVLTGDFAYHDAGLVAGAAVELGRLDARLGRFAVLGNHDYWTDPRVVSEALLRNGIDLLTNSATNVDTSTGLWLAGVDDVFSGRPDLQRALRPLPAGAPVVLLCHEPDFADNVPAKVGIQLSGHTHGGQVNIPGFGRPVLPSFGLKYPEGLYQASRTLVYVNRGLGVINPPIRINCPPEVTLITLHPSRAR